MSDLQRQIHKLTADRHSPEAMALFETLLRYIHKRVHFINRNNTGNAFSNSEVEDLVSDVLLQLVNGSLAQFRGHLLPELLAFVRTVTDRRIWRVRSQMNRNREMLKTVRTEKWSERTKSPEATFDFEPDTKLSDDDERYLEALLHAGSKAEFARQNQLSRAAVTQRVKRIQSRIRSLCSDEQLAVESWLKRAARTAVLEDRASLALYAKPI